MNKALLGIDLGTSSVKVLLRLGDGTVEKTKVGYEENTPAGWLAAVQKALRMLDLRKVSAVGLSAQTGTYIVNKTHVIGWGDPVGKCELDRIRGAFSPDLFLAEIGMPHPAMTSYPLPRLLYIKQHFANVKSVCQPKDLICEYLTGKLKSDPWTWRGLAHPESEQYSKRLLDALDIDPAWLPPLTYEANEAGTVTAAAAAATGLPQGTPVIIGLNDFFAGLVGMGIPHSSALFDITGTSEHFGSVTNAFTPQTGMVSGRFLEGFVHYGGTASSGPSLAFGIKDLGAPHGDLAACLDRKPPIFLPYLNGERAPIFDENARGVFFGLTASHTKADMAYAVLEGVAFSVYHITKHLGALPEGDVILGGGAAEDALLNSIKATLFDRTFITLKETDTSALGAAMLAGLGIGYFEDLTDATASCVQTKAVHHPLPHLRDGLMRRFAVYAQLYTALKPQFEQWKEI
jgi:sugar (pentulose or hexulose) kinase